MENDAINLSFNKQLSNSICVAYNDIYKAFDTVLQKPMIEALAKQNLSLDYNTLLEDYNSLDLNIGNTVLKRTSGLPQGGKFSPPFFNVYIKDSLRNVDISLDYIYADNIVIFESNLNDLFTKMFNYTNNLQERNMRFINQFKAFAYNKSDIVCTEDQYRKINNFAQPVKSTNQVNDLETDRILGFQLHTKDGKLSINKDKIFSDLNIKVPIGPAYEMVNYYKQRILPKVKFNLEHIDYDIHKLNKHYLKKMMVMYKIPKTYYDQNFKSDKKTYWAKFLSLFIGRAKYLLLLRGQNETYLIRWHILCSLNEKYYIPSYQAIKFIYEGKANLILSALEQKHVKHNLKLCDELFFMIVRKMSKNTAYELITNKLINNTFKTKYYAKENIGNLYIK